jgi:molybdopterin-containing oxidoreductase family iron-sulfur binding subunit
MSAGALPHQKVEFHGVRRRARESAGRLRFYRSLEELAETPGFQALLEREFPDAASEWNDPAGRREFLRVMGASLALAGLTACTRQPEETIVPYVRAPEQVVPGKPLYFATAVSDGGYASGVLVESHMGRPTKIEGNPEHPMSLGATDVFGQAAVLGLYDPDRSQTLTQRGEIRAWSAFLTAVKTALEAQRPLRGAGLRILTETVTSPTLAAQIAGLLADYPEAKWHQWQPVNRDNVRAGMTLAFGTPDLVPLHDLEKADVVLSLDADFVGQGPERLRAIRGFSARRKPEAGAMNRLYVVESSPTLAGAMADHRLALRPSQVEGFARAVAAGLGLPVAGGSEHAWVGPLAKDLAAHAGRCLVLAGEFQPPAVHALAHAINDRLGNVGRTVRYARSAEARGADQAASLAELTAEMAAGKVDLLLVLEANPVYAAPGDLGFAEALDKVPIRIHSGLHADETAERCHWHVPATHPLEAWSDARAVDGTVTILQPLIAPLYPSCKSAHELLAAFTARQERRGHDVVREFWKAQAPAADFEAWWRKSLHDGVAAGAMAAARDEPAPRLREGGWMKTAPPPPSGIEVAFRPDSTVWDGRHANNGWLQELPKALTRITWENAALVSPAMAERLGLGLGRSYDGRPEAAGVQTPYGTEVDELALSLGGRTVAAPAVVVPGHPDGVVTVHLGYGRRRAGRVGTGLGFDAYALRGSGGLWAASGLELRKTGRKLLIAGTQDHWSMAGRPIVRAAPVEEYRHHPHLFRELAEDPDPSLTLYPPHRYDGHAWGMAIDLSACVGCNACTIACQAENNIPVVGREQVVRGREMHWIRVDRYYAGDDPARLLDDPETYHQPVPCMHCENAPCEVVCPVAATVHSDEGLNDMVYNRCVGTRYCSNNCPYKVRRFNFFLYGDWTTESLKLQRNPDVTVRSRGVMEKCTYCVQRVNQARIEARNEGRALRDGEIVTACQQVCPAEAIVFGDVNDPASRVSRLKAEPRSYGLLTELNTRPRTSYLAALKNPNPEVPRG